MSGEVRQHGSAVLTQRLREVCSARVFADRARGMSWAAIEERHGIDERQGRRIVDGLLVSG